MHTAAVSGRVDVECTDEDGTRFVVEMQLSEQEFFYERAVFNSTFAIQEQMISGQSSYDFPSVYFIGVAEIATFTPKEKFKYEFDMTTERDIKNQIAFAEKKGIEKGMEKGREEGIQEERQRILEALRSQGVPEDTIAKAILRPEGQ